MPPTGDRRARPVAVSRLSRALSDTDLAGVAAALPDTKYRPTKKTSTQNLRRTARLPRTLPVIECERSRGGRRIEWEVGRESKRNKDAGTKTDGKREKF